MNCTLVCIYKKCRHFVFSINEYIALLLTYQIAVTFQCTIRTSASANADQLNRMMRKMINWQPNITPYTSVVPDRTSLSTIRCINVITLSMMLYRETLIIVRWLWLCKFLAEEPAIAFFNWYWTININTLSVWLCQHLAVLCPLPTIDKIIEFRIMQVGN